MSRKIILAWGLFVTFHMVARAQSIPPYQVDLADSQASTGYYFLHAFKLSGIATYDPSHMILDHAGELVYYKSFSRTSSDFKLQPDGRMSYANTPGNPSDAKFMIMDSTFVVVDSVQCKNGIYTDPHDFQILANGNYLMLGYEYRIMDLSSYHWFSGNNSPGSATASVKCGVVQELDVNKNVVFTWKTADHFAFADVQEQRLSDPANVDWTHCNAVGADTDGNVILSSRFFSEVTKIDRQSGNILWRFGGKGNQFTILNDSYNGFYGQHDPRRIANGHLTLFDNGRVGNPIHPARAVEYALDDVNHTATLVWSYIYSNNSTSGQMGNVQRLANGNTMIGWGGIRNANVALSCIAPDSTPVIEVKFPDSSITYRAFNYPALSWQLHRPEVTCSSSKGLYFLDAGPGYASYLWSTGETSQTILIAASDTYYVWVPYGDGGFLSSERIVVSDILHPCSSTQHDSTITLTLTLSTGWNLLSLPPRVVGSSIVSLFPSAISNAFAYDGTYRTIPSAEQGRGFWLAFDSSGVITLPDTLVDHDTISVSAGWNLIGTLSVPVATIEVTGIPGGLTTSQFFGYGEMYTTTDTLWPGKGYWVRTNQSGQLILSSSGGISRTKLFKFRSMVKKR